MGWDHKLAARETHRVSLDKQRVTVFVVVFICINVLRCMCVYKYEMRFNRVMTLNLVFFNLFVTNKVDCM